MAMTKKITATKKFSTKQLTPTRKRKTQNTENEELLEKPVKVKNTKISDKILSLFPLIWKKYQILNQQKKPIKNMKYAEK